MSRCVATTVVVLCGCCAAPSEAAAQVAPNPVVVVAGDVDVKLGGRAVDRVVRGQVFKVGGVQGPWLWIRHRRAGWIPKQHVMPLDQAAIEYFSVLIHRQPAVAANYHARGNVWAHMGRLNHAISDFSAAIRLDPDRPASLINRGLAQHRLGSYDNAIADYDAAIQIEASNPIAYNNRGLTRHAQGEFQQAIADYNEAIRLDAAYVVAYTNRASSLAESGRFQAALEDHERALQLDPRNATDYSNRAWLLATCPVDGVRSGKQAIADATRACELSGWRSASHFKVLAAAHAESGNFKQAVRNIRSAMKLGSSDSANVHKTMLELFLARQPMRAHLPTSDSNHDAPSNTGPTKGESGPPKNDSREKESRTKAQRH